MKRREGFVLEKSIVGLLGDFDDLEKAGMFEIVLKEIHCDFGTNKRNRGTRRYEIPIEREFGDLYRDLRKGNSKQIEFLINEKVKLLLKEKLRDDGVAFDEHVNAVEYRWKEKMI